MLLKADFCYRRSRWSGSPLYRFFFNFLFHSHFLFHFLLYFHFPFTYNFSVSHYCPIFGQRLTKSQWTFSPTRSSRFYLFLSLFIYSFLSFFLFFSLYFELIRETFLLTQSVIIRRYSTRKTSWGGFS